MYWADLSRLGTGFLRSLSELYQLLFHLGSLGRITVDFARIDNGNTPLWRMLSHLQAGAVWWLTLPLPILTVYMLAAALLPVTGLIPARLLPIVATAVPIFILAVTAGLLLLKRPGAAVALWVVPPLLIAALAGALGYWLAEQRPSLLDSNPSLLSFRDLLALEWRAGSVWVIGLAVRSYSRRRPGAGYFAVRGGRNPLVPLGARARWTRTDPHRLGTGSHGPSRGLTSKTGRNCDDFH